jgi:hypothetical protein
MLDFLQNSYETVNFIGISKEPRIFIPLFETAPSKFFLQVSYGTKFL